VTVADPRYARIVADIRGRIAAGALRPGDRVPSARQITREFGVAIATASKALAALRQEGLVRAVPGVGTVVHQPSLAPPVPRVPRHGGDAPRQLTTERIVRAAIAMADSEGLAALSMRRIATELDVATMALYRHVRAKDSLVLMMADAIFGDYPPPDPRPAGWRAQLEAEARLQWTVYGRHPWLSHVVSMTRPQLLPNGMAHTEWTLRALDGLGLDVNTMLHAAISLIGYVRGTAMNFEAQAQAEQDSGLTDEEWIEAHDSEFAAAFAAGPYPLLARLTAHPGADMNLDTLFEFGLRRKLDGYAALIRESSARRVRRARAT
jgi:AcrR family transcriptional regulator